LNQLHLDLVQRPPSGTGVPPPSIFAASTQALAAWLDATRDLRTSVEPAVIAAIEDAAHLVAEERRISDKLLEDVALQRVSTRTARNALEALSWADRAVYHVWRLAESLRTASSGEVTPAVRRAQPGASR
jgi:hypothetical protein